MRTRSARAPGAPFVRHARPLEARLVWIFGSPARVAPDCCSCSATRWCPTRDGRDVVDSMVDAQMPGGWLAHPVAGRAEGLRNERLALVRREPCKRRGRVGGQL